MRFTFQTLEVLGLKFFQFSMLSSSKFYFEGSPQKTPNLSKQLSYKQLLTL